MVKMHCNKLILSIALITVLIISINIIAFADPLAGAISAAMGASGVTIGSTGAATTVGLNDLIGATTGQSDIPIGLDDEVVYFRKSAGVDPVTNIPYDEIWYSNNFSKYLQNEGLGYILDKSINPNSTGTLAQGDGTLNGVPVFDVGGELRSVTYVVSEAGNYSFGNYPFTATQPTQYPNDLSSSITDVNQAVLSWARKTKPLQIYFRVYIETAGYSCYVYNNNTVKSLQNVYNHQAFTFNYTAAAINTTPITDEQLRVRIPSSIIVGITTGTYTVGQGTGSNTIKQIADGIAQSIIAGTILDTTFISATPTPTPTPYPTDSLGDIPYDEFAGTLFPKLDDIEDTIDTVGQSIDSKIDDLEDTIDTVGQSIEDKIDDAADSVSDTIGLSTTTIIGWLEDIISAIEDGVADIVDAIEAVAEAVLEGIDDFVVDILGDVPTVFGGWFSDLSDAFGIWHYVVEWFNCISGYFTFLRTIASGMPACFWSPVLAVVAGTIVLGVYKRFLQ